MWCCGVNKKDRAKAGSEPYEKTNENNGSDNLKRKENYNKLALKREN